MAKVTRLLGKRPDNNNIRFRQTYFRGDENDRFAMRRPADFYTSVFAFGGRGRNTVELPFSSSDISYSSLTRAGNASLQFLTPSGEYQTVQASGVRRIELLDADFNVNRLYRTSFGSSAPRPAAERRTQWISNGRWDGTVETGELDTLTGNGSRANNFYLSRANNDAVVRGSNSSRVVDTLFFDEYSDDVDVFTRRSGRVNIRVNFTASTGENRSALFKGRNLEQLVLRDAYYERQNNSWRLRDAPANPFGDTGEVPEAEPALIPRQPRTIFQPLPDDIFTPIDIL